MSRDGRRYGIRTIEIEELKKQNNKKVGNNNGDAIRKNDNVQLTIVNAWEYPMRWH